MIVARRAEMTLNWLGSRATPGQQAIVELDGPLGSGEDKFLQDRRGGELGIE